MVLIFQPLGVLCRGAEQISPVRTRTLKTAVVDLAMERDHMRGQYGDERNMTKMNNLFPYLSLFTAFTADLLLSSREQQNKHRNATASHIGVPEGLTYDSPLYSSLVCYRSDPAITLEDIYSAFEHEVKMEGTNARMIGTI